MDRFGRMEEDGGRSRAAQRGYNFARDVAGFADAGGHHFAGIGQDQLDGADEAVIQPASGGRDGSRFDFHGGASRRQPFLPAIGRGHRRGS